MFNSLDFESDSMNHKIFFAVYVLQEYRVSKTVFVFVNVTFRIDFCIKILANHV